MNLTLILRDVPVKDDAAYKVLYSLCPHKIIYSVDFGVRAFPRSEEETTRAHKKLNEKVDALKQIVPFNGASEIAPMFPSYWFSETLPKDILGYAAGEAFRLFAGIKTVYFDLGVQVNIQNAKAMAETVHRLSPDVQIGVIAPLSEYVKEDGALHQWVLGTTNLFPCPFVNGLIPLLGTLTGVATVLGPTAEVFISSVGIGDGKHLSKIAADDKLSAGVKTLVFWSPIAARNAELPVKSSCEEEKPVGVPSPYKEMRALFTSIIRDRKNMLDAEVVGHVGVGDSIKVVSVLKPDGEGTAFGEVEMDDGKHGYIVLSHFNQKKFEEVESES